LNVNQKITKKMDAFLNVGNILNTSYIDIVGYKTKPRNYTLGVNYLF
jgi:vitamin B12 transporter